MLLHHYMVKFTQAIAQQLPTPAAPWQPPSLALVLLSPLLLLLRLLLRGGLPSQVCQHLREAGGVVVGGLVAAWIVGGHATLLLQCLQMAR